MEKLRFNTTINASRDKVWDVLWGNETYTVWTQPFGPDGEGGRVETDWKEGSKVLFLGDGGSSGMVSRIAELRDTEYISFEHLGEVKDGVEDTTSDKVKQWAGGTENYTLKEVDGKTELHVDMDITPEHKDYFAKAWPQAMEKVRELAEKN